MKRCVVKYRDGFCNIPATMICREDAIVYVFNGTDLVGVFDLGYVDAIYLTEKAEKSP